MSGSCRRTCPPIASWSIVSGIAEIAGGVAAMHPNPEVRRWGSLWSVATLVAVFPANLHMALNPERYEKGIPGGRTALYIRLPIQLLFIAWAWAVGRADD